jgi:hypothetical protein
MEVRIDEIPVVERKAPGGKAIELSVLALAPAPIPCRYCPSFSNRQTLLWLI